jgi:hypothetical protein
VKIGGRFLMGVSHFTDYKTCCKVLYLFVTFDCNRRQPVDADRCFDRLSQTEIVLQLAVYYYAIQLVRQLRVGSVLSSRCDELYQLPVENLISTVNSYLQLQQQPVSGELSERTQQLIVRFQRYKSRLMEYMQAQALQQLDRGWLV